MSEKEKNHIEFSVAVVRVCPACGIVNPAGPSESCPHVQLIRLDGVDPQMAKILVQVANARQEYNQKVSVLKEAVKTAVKNGQAKMETTQTASFSALEKQMPHKAEPLQLTNPSIEQQKPRKQSRKRPKKRGAPPVDPKQLDLLSMGPAKADA